MPIDKAKILAGRQAVKAYREAHAQLEAGGWHKGLSEEHTPLLNIMLKALKELGFSTLPEFFDASNEQCLIDTGIFQEDIRQNREDLLMVAGSATPHVGVLASVSGVSIEVLERKHRSEVLLLIDGAQVMCTDPDEHISMRKSVLECPYNARVFIGGLGLSLVVLYLALAGKASHILICEIDDRVLQLMGGKVRSYFAQNYPDLELEIIKGDVLEEVTRHGVFDWIYVDLSSGAPPEFKTTAQTALTTRGVYTAYQPYIMEWK